MVQFIVAQKLKACKFLLLFLASKYRENRSIFLSIA